MADVPIHILKAKLSKYLNIVHKKGEKVYIRKHDKIIACLVPYDEQSEWQEAQKHLKESVSQYKGKTDPVEEDNWWIENDNA